jgi:amino acid permease
MFSPLDLSCGGAVTSLVLTCIQNVEFQKLELKWSARKSNKVVFLFLSPTIPRFSFGFDDVFRVYNLLVWQFGSSIGILFGFYLGEFKFELEFKFESILRPKENW